MHRQQKTFTPSSFILPLAVTALVIFLASSANAQDAIEPVGAELPPTPPAADLPQSDLPPSLDSLARPIEARMAPSNAAGSASGTTTRPRADLSPMNRASVNSGASNTPATLNQNFRADLEARRAAWANDSAERRLLLERKRAELASSSIERKAALNEKVQERMTQRAENLISVLSGALTRIKNVNTNLRERAESMSSQGIDVAEAITLLDQIDDLIKEAESSLSGIDVNVEYTLTSETPKEAWVDTKTQFQTTAEIIRTIRPLLQETVTTLKEAIKNASPAEAI